MVRTALVVLSIGVVLAVGGALRHGTQLGAGDALTPAPPPAAATPLHEDDEQGGLQAATATATVTATVVDAEPDAFTLRQLRDGDVSAARFAAFWDAELERIRRAPCPAPVAAGSTVVTALVGATPPAHLGDGYTDYAPLLAEARAAAAAACA